MIKVFRYPNHNVYDIFLTLIMAFTLLIIIYALTPLNHCSIYFHKK